MKGEGLRASSGRRRAVRSRRTVDFDHVYQTGTPQWDIGRPQRAFLELARIGEISGSVLDVGCGTGEHALMAAGIGLDVTGIDISPTAIQVAELKARDRRLRAKFLVISTLRMTELDEQFDTVLDCGMFHLLRGEERLRFTDSLRAVLRPGGRYFMMCFSDQQPGYGAAQRISQQEIISTFGDGLCIDSIESTRQEENRSPGSVPAWLVKITRARAREPA